MDVDDENLDDMIRDERSGATLLRFGRAPLLRYGKRASPLLRFGKRAPLLRFGKRPDTLLRFGRSTSSRMNRRYERPDVTLRFGWTTTVYEEEPETKKRVVIFFLASKVKCYVNEKMWWGKIYVWLKYLYIGVKIINFFLLFHRVISRTCVLLFQMTEKNTYMTLSKT